MFTVDVVTNNFAMLPKKFYESLPLKCPICGYPIEISETLTGVHCSNAKCGSKNAQRLSALCNKLGIKNLGERRCASFLSNFHNCSPLFIFEYDPNKNGVMGEGINMDLSKSIYNEVQSKKSFTLAEYVQAAQIPEVQTSALALFGEFNTLADAYAPIQSEGVKYIAKKLNIATTEDDISIRAMKVYESLMTFKSELEQYEPFVNIVQVHTEGAVEITAVCSDAVGMPFRTKADFYAVVNNKHPKLHVTFLGAVNKNIDYLVWAGADGTPAKYTNKVQKVEGYNKQYQAKVNAGTVTVNDKLIPIVTGMQFLAICTQKLKDNGFDIGE